MPTWIIVVGWITRLVLLALILLSVWSVSIIIDRKRALRPGDPAKLKELRNLVSSRDWSALTARVKGDPSPEAGTLAAALSVGAPDPEIVERAVKSYLITERTALEQGFTALATLGSNAPFIGLFGTVLGIIQAFGALSQSSASASGGASVMGGISEALVATAIGLFVAIPAVIAYNYFGRILKVRLSDCESLRDLYIAQAASTAKAVR